MARQSRQGVGGYQGRVAVDNQDVACVVSKQVSGLSERVARSQGFCLFHQATVGAENIGYLRRVGRDNYHHILKAGASQRVRDQPDHLSTADGLQDLGCAGLHTSPSTRRQYYRPPTIHFLHQ